MNRQLTIIYLALEDQSLGPLKHREECSSLTIEERINFIIAHGFDIVTRPNTEGVFTKTRIAPGRILEISYSVPLSETVSIKP